jgi:hypothetical protein
MYNLIGLEGLMCHQRNLTLLKKLLTFFFLYFNLILIWKNPVSMSATAALSHEYIMIGVRKSLLTCTSFVFYCCSVHLEECCWLEKT